MDSLGVESSKKINLPAVGRHREHRVYRTSQRKVIAGTELDQYWKTNKKNVLLSTMFSKLFGTKKNEESADLSGLTEEQRTALFEKYAFSKFDKKYFKLLIRKTDTQTNELAADLEYEFRHNAFVRKFAVVCVNKKNAENDSINLENAILENFKAYGAKNNIELYIVLGLGTDPEKPNSVFTIPVIHFKTNPVSLASIEVFKKEPNDDFFYQRDIDCLT